MGSSNAPHVMTLINSIIGCGILLASLILVFSNLMTRLSCHFLLKASIMTRRKTFELLAFHTFGSSGKITIELSIILLMIGTCIAFFVVMGDLGPAIIGPLLQIEYSTVLRPVFLIGIAVFVVLPLGMLRNVDSLSSICTASFLFYLLLVVKVFLESMDNLFSSAWMEEVEYWRPSGILQCLPIFSMALSCQTQLLEILDSVQNGSLDKMNLIVKNAIDICTALYMAVGFLGYVAYYKQTFTGNLLVSFSPTSFSEFIKLGFVLSVAVTFPMVIFPCRTSLYSLLFRRAHAPHYELVSGGGNHIPEAQFKCITFFIITSSLIVGLLAPNIETVLGLLGSTIGVIICVLCPPLLLISISSKATTEKVLAQMMCALGFFIMFMGTYANLYFSDTSVVQIDPALANMAKNIPPILIESENKKIENILIDGKPKIIQDTLKVDTPPVQNNKKPTLVKNADVSAIVESENKRIEPPVPMDSDANKKENTLHDKPKPQNKLEKNVAKLRKDVSAESKDKQELIVGQKEVLQKLRPQKSTKDDSDRKISFESEHSAETNGKPLVRKQLANDGEPLEVNKKDAESKNVATGAQKNVVQKQQSPLPIPKTEAKDQKVDDSVQENEPVKKPQAADREKRDLTFVDNMANELGNMVDVQVSQQKSRADRIRIEEVGNGGDKMKVIKAEGIKMSSDSMVALHERNLETNGDKKKLIDDSLASNIMKSANKDPHCKKEQLPITDATKSIFHKDRVISSKIENIIEKNSEKNVEKSILTVSNNLAHSSEEEGKITKDEQNVNLILTPSKLSEPKVKLDKASDLSGIEKTKVTDLRSMSRDLKAVHQKSRADERQL